MKAGMPAAVRIDKWLWAAAARMLYEEDEASRARRAKQIALRRLAAGPGQDRRGRPTKRERRQLERGRDKSGL